MVTMKKIRLLNIIFMIAALIATIPLTIEVFGDMNPDIIMISAIIIGIGLAGNLVCVVARAIMESKKQ